MASGASLRGWRWRADCRDLCTFFFWLRGARATARRSLAAAAAAASERASERSERTCARAEAQSDARPPLPRVHSPSAPESLLLRRKNTARLRAQKSKTLQALKKTRKSVRLAAFKRAEKYAKEYRVAQKNEVRMKRLARNSGSFYLEPEAKLAFVIRIRG